MGALIASAMWKWWWWWSPVKYRIVWIIIWLRMSWRMELLRWILIKRDQRRSRLMHKAPKSISVNDDALVTLFLSAIPWL